MSYRVPMGILLAAVGVGVLSVANAQPASAARRWAVIQTGNNEAEDKIFATLDAKTTLDFTETPLSDVVEYLSELHSIEILLDTKLLDKVGIGSDTPITCNLKVISLRSALRLMLKDLGLTYLVADEVLQITTPEEANKLSELRVYNVSPMLELNKSADTLALTLEQALAHPRGKPTTTQSITVHGQMLIVRDTLQGHRALAELLDAISDAQTAFEPAPRPELDLKSENGTNGG